MAGADLLFFSHGYLGAVVRRRALIAREARLSRPFQHSFSSGAPNGSRDPRLAGARDQVNDVLAS